jgi:cell division protein FtsN
MDQPAEGSRLDLDNRKLIIAFVLLMCVCAGFYVFGFVEGKRQAQKLGEQKVNAGVPAPADQQAAPAPSETKTQSAKAPAAPPRAEKAVKEQLDWYKKVHSPGELSPKDLMEDKKTAARTRAGAARKSAQPPHTSGYSVQIGAFKRKREVEAKAAILKAKGYDYVIQPPGADRDLYLLKVGRFESRAQAYAMQQKLKKDGFGSFIKTN